MSEPPDDPAHALPTPPSPPSPPPTPPPGPGTRFGRFVLREPIGQGGMGAVWKADQPELGRAVALKFLREDEAGDPRTLARFLREARSAGRLRHPNIVAVHEAGEVEGQHYLAMDWVDGEDLAHCVARTGPLPARRAVELVRDAARAIHYAHGEGIVHRDLKPANLLVDGGGRVFVTDFGLAKGLAPDTTRLSITGEIVGTPAYLAPEQAQGAERDGSGNAGAGGTPASDVYGLGAVLYHLLTGRPPFTGDGALEVLLQVAASDPPRPRTLDPRVHRDAEVICLHAMEKDPARRYASAADLADDCERFLAGEPIRTRAPGIGARLWRRVATRRGLAATVAGALAAVGLAAGVLVPGLRRREAEITLERELHRLEVSMREARPLFYVPGPDVFAKLVEVRTALDALATALGDARVRGRSDAWTALGLGWEFVGDEREAERALRQAVALAPGDGAANFGLGRIDLQRSYAAHVKEESEAKDEAEARAREYGQRAVEWLERCAGWQGGTADLDRAIVEAVRALAAGHVQEACRISESALRRFGDAVGAEEFWSIRGLAAEGPARIDAFTQALRIRPHYRWGYLMRAIEHQARGDAQSACADLSECLRLNPRDPEPWFWRGLTHKNRGELEAALDDLSAAIKLDPGHVRALARRAMVRRARGELPGALADAEAALRAAPRSALAFNTRAGIRLAQGDAQAALADWDQALRLVPRYSTACFNRALARRSLHDLDGALADLDAAIHLDPDRSEYWYGRGAVRQDRSEYAGAVADYSEALRLNPLPADTWLGRGIARRSLGEVAGAISDFTEAVRRDPGLEEAWRRRGAAREETDPDGALADYTEALRAAPRSVEALIARGTLRRRRRDFAAAIADFTEALRIDPTSALAADKRAFARQSAGDLRGAIQDYTLALRIDPHDLDGLFNRAAVWDELGELPNAIADWDEYIRQRPTHAPAHAYRADLRLRTGDRAGALADAESAVRLDPHAPDGYVVRSSVREAEGRTQEQIADLAQALEVAPAGWPMRPTIEAVLRKLRRPR